LTRQPVRSITASGIWDAQNSLMRIRPKPSTPPHAYALSNRAAIDCSKLIKMAMPVGFRLPAALERFKFINLRTDKTLDENDLPLLTQGLAAFARTAFESSVHNTISDELTLLFSRGKKTTLNEIVVYGKARKPAASGFPYKFNVVLISDQPERVGKPDH
jgi:hypothetical protein